MEGVFHIVHHVSSNSVLLFSVDTHWMTSQNLSRIKGKFIFSSVLCGAGSTIKGFTAQTTIFAHHPDRLPLLLQATAPPDGPPAPASSLIQTTSLWFPTAKRSRRLNLSTFCSSPPTPPLSAHLPVTHRCGLDCGSRESTRMNMPELKWS